MRGESAPPVPNRAVTTATIICACVMQGRRHDDRQCLPAAHPGQHVGVAGPDLVGIDVLHRLLGDHDAADRLARRPLWRQIHLSRLGRRLHDRLGVVRRRDEPLRSWCFYRVLQGVSRRRAGAARAGDAVYDLPARAPRLRDGDLQHRRDDGADHRPDPRRLADREPRLALVLLHQPAGRGVVRARHLRLHPPVPPDAARPVRHVRLCDAEPRGRLVAIDARPRPAQGLVPLDRDLDRGDDRRRCASTCWSSTR